MESEDVWHLPRGDEEKMKTLAARAAESKKAACRELIPYCLSIKPMTTSNIKEVVPRLYRNLVEEFDELDLDPSVSGKTARNARDDLLEEGIITQEDVEKNALHYAVRICACGAPVPLDEEHCSICGWQLEFRCPACHGMIALVDLEDDPRHCPQCREEIDVPTPWVSGTDLMSPPDLAPVQEQLADLVGRADPKDVDMATEELTQILRGRQLIGHARRMRQLVDDASTMTDGDLVEGVAELLEDAGFRD